VEFTGPVGAEYEIDDLTRPKCLIQYSLIVDLSSPKTSLNTKMQIILGELHMIRTICAPNGGDKVPTLVMAFNTKYRIGKCVASRLEVVEVDDAMDSSLYPDVSDSLKLAT